MTTEAIIEELERIEKKEGQVLMRLDTMVIDSAVNRLIEYMREEDDKK